MGGEGAAAPGAEPGLEMMLHCISWAGGSSLPSEAMALHAVAPASLCCVHVTENRGSTIPNRWTSLLQ